ncbi:hypothetical protein XH84_31470 [Bradyrhizobium nanningense]|nr:hypothetical protein XH84_31470 [Bradyrhizobium nanningense]
MSNPHQYDETVYPLQALPLMERDWKILEALADERREAVCSAYLELVTNYIKVNRNAVRRLIEVESSVSRDILNLEMRDALEAFSQLKAVDKQSLFAFKLYCAINADNNERIADYFAKNPHSDWVRQHFLYPLIFYFINVPTKETFEQVLTQTFPNPGQRNSELGLVKLLVADDVDFRTSLAFKCYSALLCHPFDAFQLLLSYFETAIAAGRVLAEAELSCVRSIYEATDSPRFRTVLDMAQGRRWDIVCSPGRLPICAHLNLSRDESRFLEAFVSVDQDAPKTKLDGIYPQLSRLRWERYPNQTDFGDVVGVGRRYGFCEVGRLVTVLLTSLYMIERRSRGDEFLHLIRQVHFFGTLSPFTLCSPRGAAALDSNLFAAVGDPEQIVDASMSLVDVDTRWWLKRIHWRLRSSERTMRISEWLATVRRHIPLSGNSRFLSGIDWSWIDQVIGALRIRPFQGDLDGIYVLLIRAVEQRQREPNSLMLALAPLAPSGGRVGTLVQKLIEHYRNDAVAFVRFFLTPSMILKMRLETNYTAALSERLNALEKCAAEFGFEDEIMTAEQFAFEQRSLTSALTFITVGTAQFELPWEIFTTDALSSVADEFRTFLAVDKTYNSLPLLSDARTSTSHVYRNKEVRTYEFRNREWPLVVTICLIIDLFLSHPSYGIESILAIRIRHDNLRREFALALAALRRTKMLDVTNDEKARCLQLLESSVYSALQSWIDVYMHTKKTKLQRGIFEFLPDQAEMASFVAQLHDNKVLEDVVGLIASWLRQRLDVALHQARSKLMEELQPSLRTAMDSARNALAGEQVRMSAVERVIGTAEVQVMQKVGELQAWFEMPIVPRKEGLSYSELKSAVEGRFHDEVASGRLIITFEARRWADEVIAPENIRPLFDLWCELTINALKYSERDEIRIRVHPYEDDLARGLVFSSLRRVGRMIVEKFVGVPTSVNEPMLKAGKSGLKIVAALSASIMRRTVTVEVSERKFSFHVQVPLVCKVK